MFNADDLVTLAALVADTWRGAIDRDWSARAGVIDWSCTRTAGHAVDCVWAPALFLASRRTDSYPPYGFYEPAESTPAVELAEACETAARMLVGTVLEADDDVRAVIWLRPEPTVAPPADFLPRGGLELLLHAHDVCTGLGVSFDPPRDLCDHLRAHVADWPYFTEPGGWPRLSMTGDPWDDLLRTSGRR